MLHVVAGSVIHPTTPSLRRAQNDGQVMIVERELSLDDLKDAGRNFMIDGLVVGSFPGAYEMPVYDAGGRQTGVISWKPRRPGNKFLWTSSIPAFFVLALLAGLNVVVIRNWMTIERKLQAARLRAISVEQAGRMRAVLLAHLSHELRTPLNAIIGFAQLIKLGAAGTNAYQGYAQNIESGGHKLLSIMDTVLELARIERGEFESEWQSVNFEGLLSVAVGAARVRGEETGVNVAMTCPASLPVLCSDERAIERIVAHLLDNAVKFSPRGATVDVKVTFVCGALEIGIHDRGSGMSPDVLARATMPFGLRDSAMTQQRQGVGLGLALCHALCNELGARLRIESALGKGTSVYLVLPLDMAQPAERAVGAAVAAA